MRVNLGNILGAAVVSDAARTSCENASKACVAAAGSNAVAATACINNFSACLNAAKNNTTSASELAKLQAQEYADQKALACAHASQYTDAELAAFGLTRAQCGGSQSTGVSPVAQKWLDIAAAKGTQAVSCATGCVPTFLQSSEDGANCMMACGLSLDGGGGSPQPSGGCPSGYVWNPSTGTCRSTYVPVAQSSNTMAILLLAAGAAFFLLQKKG